MGIPGHWSWMNFTTSEAAKRLNLKAERHEVREILTSSSSCKHNINECMNTGPSLQPLLWEIIRIRMSERLLLKDIKRAFLRIGIKEEDRDAFRFLFTLRGKQEHLRFARVPLSAQASPFILGATLR